MRAMIVVYSDDKKLMLELLAKGREIADGLNKTLVGLSVGESTPNREQDLIYHGADQVVIAGEGQEHFKAEEYSEILTSIINELPAEIVIIGNTKNGKELAARVAGKMDVGCITGCTKLDLNEGKELVAERIVYGGNALAVQSLTASPQIYTMAPRVTDALPKDETRKGEIIKKEIAPSVPASKIINVREKKVEGVNIEDAEIIVSCGRGMKKKEDISLIKELANLLHGETIGCSRPISADLNWLSEDHWVGLSGHKVKPRIYVAVGISGQIQHLAGMRGSDVIVAINKDPEAPIFKATDYGIVGDLYQALPFFIQAIKQKLE